MKVLLVGAGGQVGRAVLKVAPAHARVISKTRSELDIRDGAAVLATLRNAGASWLINAAAYTAVDLAEDEISEAVAVNETAVGALAGAASRAGCRLLHLSTDFVFDGQSSRAYLPGDPPHPLSVYGVTKLGGEALAMRDGAIVLRTSWVYAACGRNFVCTMLRLMRDRPEIRVVCDQIGAPTWASSLGDAIWGLVDASAPSGIYHWTDLGVASWYDFAVAIQEEAVIRGLLPAAVNIVPIKTEEYPTRAKRPAFSVLDTSSSRNLISAPARHWRTCLRMMLDELQTA